MRETYLELSWFARPNRDYFILLILATLIAVIGLLLNNIAVIMGAIWVAPTMGPILGLSLSIIAQRQVLISRYAGLLVVSLFTVILLSYLVGTIFSFLGFTDAILERTQPNILHIFLALIAGFLAAYGKIRQSIVDRAFGLAVSVSLFPPLCVIGLVAAHGRMDLTVGAALLFGSNLASILCGAIFAFALLDMKRYHLKTIKQLIVPGVFLIVLAVPLFISFQDYAIERQVAHETREFFRTNETGLKHIEITNIEIEPIVSPLTIDIYLKATPSSMQPEAVNRMKAFLEKKLHSPVQLILHLHNETVFEVRS